ncbi:hypothetical protein DPMN_062004 [Dreissena polymorpha]|uniref:Uncharacterized protein n=1 Tax=Dreissena polymorpha TaxID=45954 RepID=A0A9D4C818_DREPO|nr:hypothetical protein DPMN_062004 [Dreissena polymorpha]
MASAKRRSEIHVHSVEDGHLRFYPMAPSLCCVSQDFLLNINFPLWLLNPSRSQVFLELEDMKMKINSSAYSGL